VIKFRDDLDLGVQSGSRSRSRNSKSCKQIVVMCVICDGQVAANRLHCVAICWRQVQWRTEVVSLSHWVWNEFTY